MITEISKFNSPNFLWFHAKGKLYASNPRTTNEFKGKIPAEYIDIPLDMLQKVTEILRKAANFPEVESAEYLPEVIFTK